MMFFFLVEFAARALVFIVSSHSAQLHAPAQAVQLCRVHDAAHKHGVTIPVHAVQLVVHVFLPKAIMN